MNTGKYINVPYKGAYYMCVEGSDRAKLMTEANVAWKMGYTDLSIDLHLEAIKSPGCAFEHREGVRHG